MQILLTDVFTNEPEVFDTGTCELCYSSVELEISEYEFTYPDGKISKVENIMWDWGDYYELEAEHLLDNIPAFAAWLKELDFKEGLTINFSILNNLITAFVDEDNYYIKGYLNG